MGMVSGIGMLGPVSPANLPSSEWLDRVIMEGASACAAAAALSRRARSGKVVAIVSGGNIDHDQIRADRLLNRGANYLTTGLGLLASGDALGVSKRLRRPACLCCSNRSGWKKS
jgi:hypothetical protein